MTHSVVIVDDEPPARAKLSRFLAPLPEFTLLAEADSVDSAVDAISAHHPDIVYLDIQLGERSGFEVLEAIRGAHSPHIVFICVPFIRPGFRRRTLLGLAAWAAPGP